MHNNFEDAHQLKHIPEQVLPGVLHASYGVGPEPGSGDDALTAIQLILQNNQRL